MYICNIYICVLYIISASSSTDTTDVSSSDTALPVVTISDTDSDNTASASESTEPAAQTCNSPVTVDEETTGKSLCHVVSFKPRRFLQFSSCYFRITTASVCQQRFPVAVWLAGIIKCFVSCMCKRIGFLFRLTGVGLYTVFMMERQPLRCWNLASQYCDRQCQRHNHFMLFVMMLFCNV